MTAGFTRAIWSVATDGYYWFRGRLKGNHHSRRLEHLTAGEVEEALCASCGARSRGHRQAATTCRAIVLAVVALREGMSASELELRRHARKVSG